MAMRVKISDFFWIFFVFFKEILGFESISLENRRFLIGNRNLTRYHRLIEQNFSKLFVRGPFHILLNFHSNQSSATSITDENLQSLIELTIDDDTLKIHWPIDVDVQETEMILQVSSTNQIDSIHLAGLAFLQRTEKIFNDQTLSLFAEDFSGFDIELDVFNFEIFYFSAETSRFNGQVQRTATFHYFAIGNLDATDLICQNVDVQANGLGTLMINGVDRCQIKVDGVTTVHCFCPNKYFIQSTGLSKVFL